MVFSSTIFLCVYLPLVLLGYYICPKKGRNLFLLIASLVFYAWGEPKYVFLMIFSILVNYIFGRLMDKHRENKKRLKLMLVLSVVIDIGLLSVFKYTDFIITNVNAIFGANFDLLNIALPIGISFYTFQAMSYTIDVYRGNVKPQHSYMKFFMYVSLYCQLVAGPIVRYADVAVEVDNRRETLEDVYAGTARFLVGLTKKVFIANIAGKFAEDYLSGDLLKATTAGVWFGIMMFAIQIYYDFSGYSDMAIGLGRIFGFHFLENFNYPYIARSATEFWRRWHMSLGQFFRDYVYIPMGGNRRHQLLNLFVVWFLTGFWHGASWNFILWGLWFGALIIIEKLFLLKVLKKVPVLSNIYLLFSVLIGWVLFYFTDLTSIKNCLAVMFGAAGKGFADASLGILLQNNVFWLILAVAFCLPIVPTVKRFIEERPELTKISRYIQIPANAVMLLVNTTLLVGSSYNPFLYYKF